MGIFILSLAGLSSVSFGSVPANFDANNFSGCPPLVVNFRTTSSGDSATYLWDFGNGNTSRLMSPSATFSNSGDYHVKLVIRNGLQCDSITKTITVFHPPVVNFIADKTTVCLNDQIHFQNAVLAGDTVVTQYAWGFGNGQASNGPDATHIYNQTGAYSVTLIVKDSNGCSANKTIVDYIHILSPPHAAFSASPQSSCNAVQQVNFTNESTGNGLHYNWVLDSGVTSNISNPSCIYRQEKQNVTLLATDSLGCKNQASKIISAINLIADFKAAKTVVCTGQNVNFTNLSNFPGTSCLWNFGDGTTSTAFRPVKQYFSEGYFTVTLLVKDGICNGSITRVNYIKVINGFHVGNATFNVDSMVTCGKPLSANFTNTTPGGVYFHWDFGNGDTSALQNPFTIYSNPGNYTVTLIVTDQNGCQVSGRVIKLIQTSPPVAKFRADTFICLGSDVHFINESLDAQRYFWDFGDGDTSGLFAPLHHYRTSGYYSVKLTAYNIGGCDTSLLRVNYVHVHTVHLDFDVSSNFSPCPPFACTFTNRSDNGLRFLWDFGDGFSESTVNPTHIYFYRGNYSVSLTGYSSAGCTDSIVYHNLIKVQGPGGAFNIGPKAGCAPLNVIFDATVSGDTRRVWSDMGDGTIIQDSLHFNHLYNTARLYHPQFILEDYTGCRVFYPLDSILVKNTPEIRNLDTFSCSGTPLAISLASTNRYQWTPSVFLNCDTCNLVTINAVNSILYNITATAQSGCKSTGTFRVRVTPVPEINTHEVHLCRGDSLRLFTGNADSIRWSPSLFLSDTDISNPVCTPLNSVNYNIHASNSYGCSVSKIMPVVVIDAIRLSATPEFVICRGGTVHLSTTLNSGSDLGTQYVWGPSQYLSDPDIPDPVMAGADSSIIFQLIVSSGNCVKDTEKIIVDVNQPPIIRMTSSVTCAPFSEVKLSASSNWSLNYNWSAEDPLSCENCSSTSINPSISQIVYVKGIDQNGCIARDSVLIQVVETMGGTIFIPNAFSPNGDGENDVFEIYGDMNALEFFDVRIFDRWGEEIFRSNDHNFKWDGTYKGRLQYAGTYSYQIQLVFKGDEIGKLRTGSIALLR